MSRCQTKRAKANEVEIIDIDLISDESSSDDEPCTASQHVSYMQVSHHTLQANGRILTQRTTERMDVGTGDSSLFPSVTGTSNQSNFGSHLPYETDHDNNSNSPAYRNNADASDDDTPPSVTVDPQYEELLKEERPLSKSRAKRPTDYPLLRWEEERETFLSEALRAEARTSLVCTDCVHKKLGVPNEGRYRCVDCEGDDNLCGHCILLSHRRLGLHRVEKWSNARQHFERITLSAIGYRFQLGHAAGGTCLSPEPSFGDTFTIIDITGVHSVKVDFCGCGTAAPAVVQLLRFQWFPATVKAPRTATTMRTLKLFDLLSCQSKCSILEFYSTLSRLSDNTGTSPPKDRYTAFARMQREYMHIKALKRGGRGHSESGAAGTAHGELAVLCPACPLDEINITPVEELGPEDEWLNRVFKSFDANYRLRRKAVSSDAADPSLSKGWIIFAPDFDYMWFVKEFGKEIQQKPSTCSNHDAVNKDRGKAGYAASGTGAVNCSRHDMKVPCGMGDLQKGERYVNMDYLFISSLRQTKLTDIVVTYDIGCQWSVNLPKRLDTYGPKHDVRIEGRTFTFVVPKFHLPAHKEACQTRYSLNFIEKVGRTDGEGIERGWDNINPIATSTREMGPGARRDRLDHVLNDHNWVKVTRMVKLILKRIGEAVPMAQLHATEHSVYSEGIEEHKIKLWQSQISAWQLDQSAKPNPYRSEQEILTEEAVRHRIAEQAAVEEAEGRAYVLHDAVSASQFLILGIALQDSIRRLKSEQPALTSDPTDEQRARIKNKSTNLHRRIKGWIAIQELYMPHVIQEREKAQQRSTTATRKFDPTKISLLMPSAMPATTPCDDRLLQIEWELRQAQCGNALEAVRNSLRLSSYLLYDKRRNSAGQHMQTRSNGLIATANQRTRLAADRYTDARIALIALESRLGKGDESSKRFKVLRVEDQVALPVEILRAKKKKRAATNGNEEEAEWEVEVPSEGRRTVSWIWKEFSGVSISDDDYEYHDSIRTEWCRSEARAARWREEVQLLMEERRRTIRYFEYQEQKWKARQADISEWTLPGVPLDKLAIEGRRAYAGSQATVYEELRMHCVKEWRNVDAFVAHKGIGVTLTEGLDDDDPEEEESVDVAEAIEKMAHVSIQ